MLIKSFTGAVPNILHFQGKSHTMFRMFEKQVDDTMQNKFEGFPENVTVLTTFTDKDASPLVYQLENNNVPYINSYREEYGPFVMTDKIMYIVNALKEVKTDMVIILDGYDVLIQNFDNLLENFKSYNTRMLFNASKNNYPIVQVDRMPFRDYIGQFNHFNAGCAIGYTEDFLKFYSEALELMNREDFFNPYHSEQYVLRHIFAKYSEHMLDEEPYMSIDYACKVFLALSQAYVFPKKEVEEEWHAI